MKSKKLRDHARDQECTLRIFPYCNGDSATVVFCHAPSLDKGMGTKSPDWWGAYGCSACHDIMDGRHRVPTINREERYAIWLDGIYLTLKRRFNDELITVRGN